VIRTDLVYTLRDLRDERPPVERRISWAQRSGRGYMAYRLLEASHLLELSLVALEWRKEDRLELEVPAGEEAPLTGDVLSLVEQVGGLLSKQGPNWSLYAADCTLVLTHEPAEVQAA
jgi:hypothetical protein